MSWVGENDKLLSHIKMVRGVLKMQAIYRGKLHRKFVSGDAMTPVAFQINDAMLSGLDQQSLVQAKQLVLKELRESNTKCKEHEARYKPSAAEMATMSLYQHREGLRAKVQEIKDLEEVHQRVEFANASAQGARGAADGVEKREVFVDKGVSKMQAAIRSKQTRQTAWQADTIASNAEAMMDDFAKDIYAYSPDQLIMQADTVKGKKRELEMKRRELKGHQLHAAVDIEMQCEKYGRLHQEMKIASQVLAQRAHLQELDQASAAVLQAAQAADQGYRQLGDLWVFRDGECSE
jgi:hypothetical protein